MGLDMYAARRLYVKQWGQQKPEEKYSVQITKGGKRVRGIQSERIAYIEEELMYWRKANHIHSWFVENVQNGNDDCKSYYVSENKLNELLLACMEVLKASELVDGGTDKATVYGKVAPMDEAMLEPIKVIKDATVAKKLLPTKKGFFFGSYEYDEDYIQDVKDTHEWLFNTLTDMRNGVPGDIYYRSSW